MSHRPLLTKKANRLRKAFRQSPPAYINLIDWLMDHGHANTKRQAKDILLAGRVRSESHVLGVQKVERLKPVAKLSNLASRERETEMVDEVRPVVSAKFRKTLHVKAA